MAIFPSVQPQFALEEGHSPEEQGRDGVFGFSAQQEAIRRYGIAGKVWEAAYAMDFYVQNPLDMEFDPPFASSSEYPMTVLELGSGTGMVGSRIAAKFLRPEKDLMIVTDLPDVCPLLTTNLGDQLKKHDQRDNTVDGGILVRPLAWGNYEHASKIASELFSATHHHPRFLTHIVCSDLIYFPELLAPLLRTLIQITSPPFVSLSDSGTSIHEPQVLISYKVRSLVKETPFWSAFGLWFTFEPVLMRHKPQDVAPSSTHWTRVCSSDGFTFVFAARRRPSSFEWHVPLNDLDLMNGVGAWGTNTSKADDTFETFLLMLTVETTADSFQEN